MIYLGIDPAAGHKPNALAAYVPDADELFLLDIAQPTTNARNAAYPKLGSVILSLRARYPGQPMKLGLETQFTYQDSPPKGSSPAEIKRWKAMRANQAMQAQILSAITGGYTVIATQHGVEVVGINQAVGKFAIAEHGNATPGQVETAVRHIYGVALVSNDQAHACGVMLAVQRQDLLARKRTPKRKKPIRRLGQARLILEVPA